MCLHRIQDQTLCSRSRPVAVDAQRLVQLLVDDSIPQTDEGLLEVRLLPNNVSHRWSTHGRLSWTRWCFSGRAQEEMVERKVTGTELSSIEQEKMVEGRDGDRK